MRRSASETGSPSVARASRGRSLWALLSVVAGFGLFGVVVWLAYQDTSHGPPTGEPPLVKAAADPIKMPPDEAEEEEARESGAVGRLWSDAERADLPERLLPRPEQPLSPEAVANAGMSEEQAQSAPAEAAESDLPRASQGGSSDPATGEGATAGLPAEAPATPPTQGGHLSEAEAALDRLLAEVAALSEEQPTPPAAPTGATNEPEAAEPPSASPPAAAATPERPSSPEAADPPAGANQEPPATGGPEIRRASALTPPVEPGPSGSDAPGATAAVAPAETTPVAAVDDRFRVQLAAVRDEADARRAWDDLAAGLGPVLSGVRPFFERADTADGTFYRVQIGPFASQEPAESLCEQLKQHNASCFVIRR
jgi:cell division septation protein DedD